MTARLTASIGAFFGLMSVACGAFGAHALKAKLEPRMLEVFETAARYQMYHALALFAAAGLISRDLPWAGAAATAFTIGVVLFSGSLYIMALSGVTWLGAVTPLGGVAFMTGWVMMVLAARKL